MKVRERGHSIDYRIQQALLECLRDVQFLRVEQIEEGPSPDEAADLVVHLCLPDGEQLLLIEVKSSGQPRLAREAINQIFCYRQSFPDAYGLFAAPYVSPRSADLCREAGVGYVDLAGNCFLSFGQIYIRREGNPNPFDARRELRSFYSPRASRVLRVLLSNLDRAWKLQELAEEAAVSLGQAYNVKKLLLDCEWVRTTADGLRLIRPGQLLAEWTDNYSYRQNEVLDFYSLKNTSDVEYDLADACRGVEARCALTGFSAAARYAPYVRYQRATAYVSGDVDCLAAQMGLKKVTSGANVILLVPYDEGVFYGSRDIAGVPVVSPVQTYLDLKGMPGRGEDAAEFLLEKTLRPAMEAVEVITVLEE